MRSLLPAVILLLLGGTACTLQKPVQKSVSAVVQLQGLSDAAYDGGLTPAEMMLSQSLAAETDAGLPGTSKPCGPPNPMAGQLIGSINEQPDPDLLAKELPPPLQLLAHTIIHGSPVQRAVALDAASRIGTKASKLAPVIEAVSNNRMDAWDAQALDALTCETWGNGDLDPMVPEGMRPPAGKDPSCDAGRAAWLLDRIVDRSRTWPPQFFPSAWEAVTDCRPEGPAALAIPEDKILALRARIDDPGADPKLLTAIFEILVDMGPRAKPMAQDSLRFVDSGDEHLARAAQDVVLVSAVPEAVGILKRWIDSGYFNWAWRDYLPGLAPYADQVIPVLAPALQSPAFTDRAAAAKGMGEMHSPAAIPYLIGAISDRDWMTSQAAVAALAQFAATSPQVQRELQDVAKSYWSVRVRKVADVALKTGIGIEDDPFDKCHYPAGEPPEDKAALQALLSKPSGCFEFNYGGSMDHGQRLCRDGTVHSGVYMAGRKKLEVHWQENKRQELPRGAIGDLSHWCAQIGSVEKLKVQGGWLLGCSGFESSGSLGFMPDDPAKPIEEIASVAVRSLLEVDGRIYVAGSEPFGFGDAGGLFLAHQSPDGRWLLEPVAALPSPPTASVVIGKSIAYSDSENAVLFEPVQGISALQCRD